MKNAVEQYARATPPALSKTDQAPAAPPADVGGAAAAPGAVEEKKETEEELNARMKELMNQSPVVVFMKGVPDAPRCGFSRQTVGILREQEVEFTSFDILTDEAVRQGRSLGFGTALNTF